jgi:hypothetical protein
MSLKLPSLDYWLRARLPTGKAKKLVSGVRRPAAATYCGIAGSVSTSRGQTQHYVTLTQALKAVIRPNQPPAFLVVSEPVNSAAASRRKVRKRKKKTEARATDERRDVRNIMKVKMNHPMR